MDLEKLIIQVKKLKDQKTLIEKDLKIIEPELKQELEGLGITKKQFPNSKLKISYNTVHRASMNSDKLLVILKNLSNAKTDFSKDIQDCIEYKPYINEEKVQNLIYKGILSIEDIQEAYEDKSYKTLRITDIK